VIPLLLSLCGAAAQPTPPPEAAVAQLMSREDELMTVIHNHDPQEHARMLRLREVDRGAYAAALFRVARVLERAAEDPAAAARWQAIREREEELRRLGRSYLALPADRRPELRARMEALAGELLELKQTERRARLEELRGRLDALNREIEAREAAREQLVREYVEQLLQERVDL
jgi:hypothetical protein